MSERREPLTDAERDALRCTALEQRFRILSAIVNDKRTLAEQLRDWHESWVPYKF